MNTMAETETTFRFDHEERVLWACTTSQATARRWKREGLDVQTIGWVGGEPHAWSVRLDAETPGWRNRWRRCFLRAVPGWHSFATGADTHSSSDMDPPEDEPHSENED